jgi:LTXXQ motif family protein
MKKTAWLTILWLPVVCFAQAEGSLAQLHDRLALTLQQQAVWNVYESNVAAYTSAYYRQKPVVPSTEDAAPHQIGRLVDNLQNRLAALEDVESAAKVLYASLSPDQQHIANLMLISTIPTFTSLGVGSTEPPADAHRKDKPDAGKRSRRGGGLAGSMSGN